MHMQTETPKIYCKFSSSPFFYGRCGSKKMARLSTSKYKYCTSHSSFLWIFQPWKKQDPAEMSFQEEYFYTHVYLIANQLAGNFLRQIVNYSSFLGTKGSTTSWEKGFALKEMHPFLFHLSRQSKIHLFFSQSSNMLL